MRAISTDCSLPMTTAKRPFDVFGDERRYRLDSGEVAGAGFLRHQVHTPEQRSKPNGASPPASGGASIRPFDLCWAPSHAVVMHAIYQAATHTINIALDDLSAAIDGLPDHALDWVPATGTNSMTVLVRHGISATKFLSAAAAGLRPDRPAYFAGDRAEAFQSAGVTAALLQAEIAAAQAPIEAILARGGDVALTEVAAWSEDGTTPTGAQLLIHGLGHLREHVGQAQLMRDLWHANVAPRGRV